MILIYTLSADGADGKPRASGDDPPGHKVIFS